MAVVRDSTVSSPTLDPPLTLRLAASLAAIVLATGAADFFGVAGYRNGGLGVVAGLAAVGAVTGLVARVRPRTWLVALARAGAIAGGLLVERAPWSTDRLVAELDDLEHLNGFDVVMTERYGSSTCRSRCPAVTREWKAPDTAPRAAVVTMAISLAEAGLIPSLEELGSRIHVDHFSVRGDEVNVVIAAQRLEPGDLRVTVVLASHR